MSETSEMYRLSYMYDTFAIDSAPCRLYPRRCNLSAGKELINNDALAILVRSLRRGLKKALKEVLGDEVRSILGA